MSIPSKRNIPIMFLDCRASTIEQTRVAGNWPHSSHHRSHMSGDNFYVFSEKRHEELQWGIEWRNSWANMKRQTRWRFHSASSPLGLSEEDRIVEQLASCMALQMALNMSSYGIVIPDDQLIRLDNSNEVYRANANITAGMLANIMLFVGNTNITSRQWQDLFTQYSTDGLTAEGLEQMNTINQEVVLDTLWCDGLLSSISPTIKHHDEVVLTVDLPKLLDGHSLA